MGKDGLFTSVELARVFGISRSKVLRIEEAGLIKPAARKKQGNSRLYDVSTCVFLSRVLIYHDAGYSFHELRDVMGSEDGFNYLLSDMEKKLEDLISRYQILKVVCDGVSSSEVKTVHRGPTYCNVIRHEERFDPGRIPEYMREALSDTISRGYTFKLDAAFFITDIPVDCMEEGGAEGFDVCVPVSEDTADDDTILMPAFDCRCVYAYSESREFGDVNSMLASVLSDRELFREDDRFRMDIISIATEPLIPMGDRWLYRIHVPEHDDGGSDAAE